MSFKLCLFFLIWLRHVQRQNHLKINSHLVQTDLLTGGAGCAALQVKTQRLEDLFFRISWIHKTVLQKLSSNQQWLGPKTVKSAGTTFISSHFPSNQRRFKCVSSSGLSKETMYFWIHPEMIYICPHGDLTLEPHAITHTWLMTPPSLGPSMPTTVCSVTRFLSDGSRAVASPKGSVKDNSRLVCASGHLACSKCIWEANKPLIVTDSWN